jgi:hypothetical protein
MVPKVNNGSFFSAMEEYKVRFTTGQVSMRHDEMSE